MNFFTETCTIKRKSVSVSNGGVSSKADTIIYTSIPCQVWQGNGKGGGGRVYDSKLAAYTNEAFATMLIEGSRTNVKQGDIVIITYPTGDRTYEIQSQPQYNKTFSRGLDSIEFTLKLI